MKLTCDLIVNFSQTVNCIALVTTKMEESS